MITSSMRPGSRSLRSARALRVSAARSTGCQPDRRPCRFPPAVRTASTITALVVGPTLLGWLLWLGLFLVAKRPRYRGVPLSDPSRRVQGPDPGEAGDSGDPGASGTGPAVPADPAAPAAPAAPSAP